MEDKKYGMILKSLIDVDIAPYLRYQVEKNPNVLDVGAFAIAVFKNLKDFIKENYGEVNDDGSVS